MTQHRSAARRMCFREPWDYTYSSLFMPLINTCRAPASWPTRISL